MVFGKKKEMIELSEINKRNVNLPHGRKFVPKDGYGFVDLTVKRKLPSEIAREKREKLNAPKTIFEEKETPAFNFFGNNTPTTQPNSDVEESLRKISMQISDLDTKLYKMEQRIELLERKAGVSNSDSSPTTGGFNW